MYLYFYHQAGDMDTFLEFMSANFRTHPLEIQKSLLFHELMSSYPMLIPCPLTYQIIVENAPRLIKFIKETTERELRWTHSTRPGKISLDADLPVFEAYDAKTRKEALDLVSAGYKNLPVAASGPDEHFVDEFVRKNHADVYARTKVDKHLFNPKFAMKIHQAGADQAVQDTPQARYRRFVINYFQAHPDMTPIEACKGLFTAHPEIDRQAIIQIVSCVWCEQHPALDPQTLSTQITQAIAEEGEESAGPADDTPEEVRENPPEDPLITRANTFIKRSLKGLGKGAKKRKKDVKELLAEYILQQGADGDADKLAKITTDLEKLL